MILIHISCETSKQANAIVDFLIDEKLMLNALVSDNLLHKQLDCGKRSSQPHYLIMGTTKALLFQKINQRVRAAYPENTPLIYAMPIVYMDDTQTTQLKTETEKV